MGGWAHGSIGTAGDVDFIAVDLVAGQSYSFAMMGIGATPLKDGHLRLYASDGTVVLAEGDNILPNGHAIVRFTAVESGRAYLQASAAGMLTGTYSVSASAGTKAQFDDEMITGALDSHDSWSAVRGTGVTLTYGFSYTLSHGQPGFSQFTPAQMELTRGLLAMFAEVAGVNFSEVNVGGYTNEATLLYGNFNASDGATSWAGGPGDTSFASSDGDVWINTLSYTPPTETPLPGSLDALMMMQLIGESLGLSRPGLYTGTGPISYATHADFVQDSAQFTVMSPFGAEETGGSALQPDTLGLHDIQALQQMYGVNLTTRTGADTYGFGTTAGPIYDFDLNLDPMLTIWDAGGVDTLDLSRYGAAQTISLIAGSQSSVGGFTSNLSISFGTVIEHAIGGRGADAITGNAAANLLQEAVAGATHCLVAMGMTRFRVVRAATRFTVRRAMMCCAVTARQARRHRPLTLALPPSILPRVPRCRRRGLICSCSPLSRLNSSGGRTVMMIPDRLRALAIWCCTAMRMGGLVRVRRRCGGWLCERYPASGAV